MTKGIILAAAMAGAMLASGAALADGVTANADNGFGRIIFTLTPTAHATASLTSGVLTIAFDRKVAIDPAMITHNLGAYVSTDRVEADGKTFHFALAQNARLHTSTSSNEIAVDLAPDGFNGTPPDLPPPPPKITAVDINKLEPLPLRVGAYSNFTRLVFDWPRNVPYTVFPGSGHLTVRFEAMAKPDFGAMTRVSPPWVKAGGWRIENKGTVVELETDTDAGFHDFRDGTHVVVDILAPKTDSAAYKPPGMANAKVTKLPAGVTQAQAQAIADTAAKVNGTPTTPAPAKPDDSKQAATPPAPTPAAPATQTAAKSPAPVPPAATPAPTAATPTPAAQPATALPTPDAKSADAQRTHDGAILVFPGTTTSAVFLRGMTAWIVLDGAPVVDTTKLKTALGDFPASLDASTGNGVSILRIGLKQTEQLAARQQGSTLRVVIAPHVSDTPTAIGFVRNDDDPKRATLSTLVPGAMRSIAQTDPTAGDALVIIPAFAGRASLDMRTYAQFAVLPTASGLVLAPFSDDLNVQVASSRVIIGEPGGLALTASSSPVADTPADLARGGDGPSYLDFASWGRGPSNDFLTAVTKLRGNAAAVPPQEANRARLTLARFYLAKGFAAEALGLINMMQASDPSLSGDAQLQTMKTAADYMMGRFHDAHNDISATAFDGDRHAALWRGLTEAALENWGDARKDFDSADSIIKRYPDDWQARARIAEAKGCIATGALECADAALAKLPKDLDKTRALEAELTRGELYAQENRYHDAQPLFAAVTNSGDERLEALAVYDNTDAGLAAGAITPDVAIQTLDKLRFRWRGDALELKTLRKLGALLFAKQRWREGLAVLRVASLNFPNDDIGRQAQDDMRNAFTDLFLKGKADKQKPVEALALFYDNIDLTPIGPDGDEMIRRMADRLMAVDLLGPAAKLLDYQVNKRLDGVARAQVAARLAMIHLMDHNPKDALATLRQTQTSGLPDDLNHQRNILQARALAALKQYDQALDMIAVDEQPDSRQLRADIYWESGNWAVAGQKTEEILGSGWSDATPLSNDAHRNVMRAAIAYSLANDQASLDRLRTHFAAKMKAGQDANAFMVVTQNIDAQGVAFRDMAGQIASIDTLEAFMQDFKKRYDKPVVN
jgi:tetratricopeptide (TPR) repeat protein